MAQRLSISNKQAVLIGIGVTAVIAGSVLLIRQKKKKKELEAKTAGTSKKSLMV